jgi:hypothetical protein
VLRQHETYARLDAVAYEPCSAAGTGFQALPLHAGLHRTPPAATMSSVAPAAIRWRVAASAVVHMAAMQDQGGAARLGEIKMEAWACQSPSRVTFAQAG